MTDNPDEEVRLTLRLPKALRDQMSREALLSGRSLNGEIVHRLEKTLTYDDKLTELDGHVAELWGKFEKLEDDVRQHSFEISSLKG